MPMRSFTADRIRCFAAEVPLCGLYRDVSEEKLESVPAPLQPHGTLVQENLDPSGHRNPSRVAALILQVDDRQVVLKGAGGTVPA